VLVAILGCLLAYLRRHHTQRGPGPKDGTDQQQPGTQGGARDALRLLCRGEVWIPKARLVEQCGVERSHGV